MTYNLTLRYGRAVKAVFYNFKCSFEWKKRLILISSSYSVGEPDTIQCPWENVDIIVCDNIT